MIVSANSLRMLETRSHYLEKFSAQVLDICVLLLVFFYKFWLFPRENVGFSFLFCIVLLAMYLLILGFVLVPCVDDVILYTRYVLMS